MPHCIIEYSNEIEKTVEPVELLNAVYRGALDSQLFIAEDIKTRTIAFDSYQAGPSKKPFVHVTVRIFSGRTMAQRKALSDSVMSQLRNIDFPPALITVEVVEMEKETYSKYLT